VKVKVEVDIDQMDCFDSCYGRHQYLTAPSKPAQRKAGTHRGDSSMRFNKLDLNLLVALDALLTELNISRAAEDPT
jgi:hypothetical protein